jgi:hypothetical protein
MQSFQLYQRGVRWETLTQTFARRFLGKNLFSLIENPASLDFSSMFYQQMEHELENGLKQSQMLYLDIYTGAVDHEGHATNDERALLSAVKSIDELAGRIWTDIQTSPYRGNTLFVVVSDHGMNVVPGVLSQGYNLPDFFNSRAGGAHHVVTNRHQLSDYKLAGLDPLVRRVTNPSDVSFYLKGKAKEYPTAWLDLDGNERAAVHLRFSDLNKIHILLLQLANPQLPPALRKAAATCLEATIDRHRSAWMQLRIDLGQEMDVLAHAIARRQPVVDKLPKKRRQWTPEQLRLGENKAALRMGVELAAWKTEHAAYTNYLKHLSALLAFEPDPRHTLHERIEDLIPPLALGDNNTIADLQHYVAGPSANGLTLDPTGQLDEARSFIHVDYFPLLLSQKVRNNPQVALDPHPIDFIDMRLPDGTYSSDVSTPQHAYWLYGGEEDQIIILTDPEARIKVMPVKHLIGNANGTVSYQPATWHAGLPLHLLEDPALRLPPGADPAAWLSTWHSEREWMDAIHLCRYSNGVIGVTEQLSPVVDNVPGQPGMDPVMLRFERRRRALVQADFHLFAADHWNFNARNFNPGGNHGSFLRISTHSVWMMEGPGVPTHHRIEIPYDSLNFASTVLSVAHRTPPMPDRVVPLQSSGAP